jgi:K+-sensing histidine kinase KdpD
MLCAGMAFALSMLSRDYAVRAAVPLTFLLTLVPVSLIAGRMTSVVVALVTSFIFAAYLFKPYGSLAISSVVERIELVCFGLAAIGVAYFSPGPEGLAKTTGTTKTSDLLETWIAIVGYAVVFTAIVTLLLHMWN